MTVLTGILCCAHRVFPVLSHGVQQNWQPQPLVPRDFDNLELVLERGRGWWGAFGCNPLHIKGGRWARS